MNFIRPLGFQDFCCGNPNRLHKPVFLPVLKKDLRTWIWNENHINIGKLDTFYVLLLFFTAFAAVVTYALVRRWQKGRSPVAQRAARCSLAMQTP